MFGQVVTDLADVKAQVKGRMLPRQGSHARLIQIASHDVWPSHRLRGCQGQVKRRMLSRQGDAGGSASDSRQGSHVRLIRIAPVHLRSHVKAG